MLSRKLRRELWRQRGQNLAIIIVMALAVCCFVASRSSYLDLEGSYAKIQKDLSFADWVLEVPDLDLAAIDNLPRLEGIAEIEKRFVISLPVVLARGRVAENKESRLRLEGRFITLELDQPPRLNRLLIESGTFPKAGNEILVEQHFAEFHGLKPGDILELEIPGAPRNVTLRVSGVAVSPEYLWVSRNQYDIMPSPTSFGVLWIDRKALRQYLLRPKVAATWRAVLGGGGGSQKENPQVDSFNPSHQILIQVADTHESNHVLERITAELGQENVLNTTAQEDLPQTEILRGDLESIRGFAIFFPTLFLVVGGSIVAVSVSRVIDSQRAIIGTMIAFGVSRRRILWHYLTFALTIGVLGTLVGMFAGVEAGKILTAAYAEHANIPRVVFAFHGMVFFLGALIGVVTAILGGIVPAYRAASVFPAQAMKPPAPSMHYGVSLLRRISGRVPLTVRLAVRNLFRRPGRNLASVGGVAAALVLIVAGSGVLDGLNRSIDVLLNHSWRYDLRVDFFAQDRKEAHLEKLPQLVGLQRAEWTLTIPIRLQTETTQLETALEGIPPNSELLRPVSMEGDALRPSTGIVLPSALARQLDVQEGDNVRIVSLNQESEAYLPVNHLTDGLGASAFMRLEDAQKLFASGEMVNTLLVQSSGPTWQMRQSLQNMPGVARVQDTEDLRIRINNFMDFNYLLVRSMMAFSAVLGIAILFTTSTLNIWERRRELATMRALGLPFRNIVGMATLEHCLLGVVGILVGIPLGIWAMRAALDVDWNFLTLPLILNPYSFAWAIGLIFCVLLLAQWPVLLSVSHLNLADVVRERSAE